jgi:hypothetical protein
VRIRRKKRRLAGMDAGINNSLGFALQKTYNSKMARKPFLSSARD